MKPDNRNVRSGSWTQLPNRIDLGQRNEREKHTLEPPDVMLIDERTDEAHLYRVHWKPNASFRGNHADPVRGVLIRPCSIPNIGVIRSAPLAEGCVMRTSGNHRLFRALVCERGLVPNEERDGPTRERSNSICPLSHSCHAPIWR